MGPNGISLRGMAHRANYGTTHGGIGMTPRDGDGVYAKCVAVRSQIDVVELSEFRDRNGVIGGGAGFFRGWGIG